MLPGADQVRIPRYLSHADSRALSRVQPALSLGMAALEWTSIVLMILLNLRLHSPLLYLVTIPWIGSRMLALGILMHEAAHYRLVNGPRGNDFLGSLFLGWPLFADLQNYRKIHLLHHWYVNTRRDPDARMYRAVSEDWAFPMPARKMLRVFLMSLSGLDLPWRVWQLRRYITEPARVWIVATRLAFYAAVGAALIYWHLWLIFLLFWVIPYVTWLNFVARLRDVAEHSATTKREGLFATRTYFYSALGQLLLAPLNVGYNLEHHVQPSAPYYRLPALHEALMAQGQYRASGHFTHGLRELLRECTAAS